jgi:hypothetical protein
MLLLNKEIATSILDLIGMSKGYRNLKDDVALLQTFTTDFPRLIAPFPPSALL